MSPKRLRAIVRLRESVATSANPQLERGQDDDETDRLVLKLKPPGRPSKAKRPKPKNPKRSKKPPKAKPPEPAAARESAPLRILVREAQVTKAGTAYEATILREGPGNPDDRNAYTREALRKAVSDGLFEGLHCYANHPTASEERDRPERDVRQLVGHFREARYVDGSPARVRAKFVPVEGPGYEWVTSLIESALKAPAGRPLVGISIDGYGDAPDQVEIGGRSYYAVRELTHLGSADIVTRAGAGGEFHRRLSESLREAEATVLGATTLDAAGMRKKVRQAVKRLEAAADGDQDALSEAVALLHDVGRAKVPKKQPRSAKVREAAVVENSARLEKLEARARKAEKRCREATSEAATLRRASQARTLLAESEVPGDIAAVWFDELVTCDSKGAMHNLLERRQVERRSALAELRESLGFDRVEGAGRRAPSMPAAPTGGGLLDRMGIDREELEASA